jgi:SAM-dependent MidA family methyltransferase
MLASTPTNDVATYAPAASGAQKLLSPAEMGELFKVIGVGRGIDVPLIGFRGGDRTHTL